jgi:hypothetical protein
LAIRQGPHKLIVDGGLAMPWAPWSAQGARGDSVPTVLYDLTKNLYEDGDVSHVPPNKIAGRLASTLLEIHNRGYARDLNLPLGAKLIIHSGWHNLRNDVTGEIGFEFRLRAGNGEKVVTHLGLFDDYDKDAPVRPARSVPTEHQRDQPSAQPAQKKKHRIVAQHVLRLLRTDSDGQTEIARREVSPGDAGELRDSFRYFSLKEHVRLRQNVTYILLMSTTAADGDRFRGPASFDGLSPLVHPDVVVRRSILVRTEDGHVATDLPAFEDLSNAYSRYRLPIGPTLLIQQ